MTKISINMLSIATIIKGHGVETAYNELINLLEKYGKNDLDIVKNKGINYDILHMHTCNPMSFIKQRLTKNKTLTYVHFMPNTLNGAIRMPKLFLKVYSWWIRLNYMMSDYLVVVNPLYVSELKSMGYNEKNIFYIPNFISSENFNVINDKDKKIYRKKYNYKENDFIVVSIGQLHKGKGVLDFIELAKANPDIKFLWIGGFNFGALMEGYDEVKKVYDNPPKNLKITGVIDRKDVNILCNISDVFLLPSYYESFALVALEAAHTEKPIILRKLPTYKDIYFDNVLYGENNNDFIKYIRKLKEDNKYYNKYVEKSRKIKRLYSEEEIYTKWLNLYKTISNK